MKNLFFNLTFSLLLLGTVLTFIGCSTSTILQSKSALNPQYKQYYAEFLDEGSEMVAATYTYTIEKTPKTPML